MSSSLDENARRAALRRYAAPGTLPEEPFDRVTRLAARWFDAPIALIAMADAEGQWIMSCYGLDERETPREVSFCAHTIQGPGVMVVENATEDERFAGDPLVTGAPGIRFYAGVPLVTSDGHRIGALCVIDTESRHLYDPDARDVLQDLAAMAMDEIEMRVAHPRHGDILESITDAFFALDDAWRFTYVNQQAETLLQRTRNELLGKNVWDEFPEAVERDFDEQYHRAMREGESVQFEAYFPPLEAWFHVNAYPFEGGLSVYFDDITERKAAEQDLEQSLERNRQILQTTIDGYMMYDVTGAIVDVNPAYCDMIGYTREELLDMSLMDVETRLDDEEVLDRLSRFVDGEFDATGPKRFETQHRHKEGHAVDVEVSVGVVEDGERRLLHAFVRNITAHKRAEQSLREHEERLASINNHVQEGIYRSTPAEGLVYVNEAFAQLFGYDTPDDLLALDDLSQLYARPEKRDALVHRVHENESFRHEEVEFQRADGSTFWGLLSATTTFAEDGAVIHRDGAVLDITDRKEQERALRERTIALEQAQAIAKTGSGTIDLVNNTIALSEEAGRLLGLDPSVEHSVSAFMELVHRDDRALVEREFERVRAGEVHDEAYRITPAGSDTMRWLRGQGRPEADEAGAVTRVFSTIADITEQKEREKQLRRQRDLLKQTQRLAGAWEYDIESSTLLWSTEVYRIHEVPPGTDIPLEEGINYYAPEARSTIRSAVQQCIDERTPWDRELPIITAKGNRRWVRTVGAPIVRGDEVVKLAGAFQDVTERKAAERALRESEERYRTLVERSHDAIYIYRGTRLLFVNDRVCELTGYAEDELLNMNVFKLVHPDDREQVRQHAIRRAEGRAPSRYEARLVRKDGSVRYGDFSVQAITYQGEYAAIGSIRDVTQRRQVEQALRESEQRFRTLAEETTDVVTRLAPDGTQLYVSPAVQDVLGYTPDELTGTLHQTIIHPDDRAQVEAQVEAARREGKKAQFEYRVQHADGHYVWVETAGQHIPGDGREATLIASTRSVAERKAAEQALVRREQRVESLYEAMQGLTAARTREQIAEHILTLIDDTLDYPISAVRYQTGDKRLVPVAISAQSQALMPERPDYDLAEKSLVARAFRRGDTARYRDVRTQNLPYDLGPVRAAAYVPIGSYGIISVGSLQVDAIDDFDLKLIEILARNAEGVLERIDREDALREARDEAEEMSRLKSAFLANMSHEIRTPLTSIIGFAEVLGEQDLGRADQFAALIRRGGQRLLDTLNSVLDLSQLEAGSMRLAPKRMEVRGAVQSAVQFFTPKARDKDITLTLDAPDEPIPAVLDEPALHRILNNLLSNAVKFTPAGGRVDVRLDPHPAHLVLQVEDSGVGIEDDFLPHLFDAFKQESSGDARAFEGSGLGLTITRQLVRLMDGEIAVSTKKGKGTRFVVRLPYRMGRNQGVEA